MIKSRNILMLILILNSVLCLPAIYKLTQYTKLKISLIGRESKLPIKIVVNDPFSHLANGNIPQPQYGVEYRKWLSVSVKIIDEGNLGSGTIVYADKDIVYVQTCGHIWGDKTRSVSNREMDKVKEKCRVVVYYDKNGKLLEPKIYDADVLYYNNLGGPGAGHDVGLLKFVPDRVFDYCPIASANYFIGENYALHSTGCDGGSEAAHYRVRVIQIPNANLPHVITTQNSPRPGRSGGGLFTENYLIGVCWGTSIKDGTGNGYFTPLQTIRNYNQLNGFGWLNDVDQDLVRKIPIRDHSENKKYPDNYIPLPEQY